MATPKPRVMQLVVNDAHNPLKQHVFRIYTDRHMTYNQAINGVLFYSRFERCTKRHGYYGYAVQAGAVRSFRKRLKQRQEKVR